MITAHAVLDHSVNCSWNR